MAARAFQRSRRRQVPNWHWPATRYLNEPPSASHPLTSLPHRARYRHAIENLAHKNMSLGDGEVVASDLFVDPED
jgi:hypothetical protein